MLEANGTNDATSQEETSEAVEFLREMMENRKGGERRPEQEVALTTIEGAIGDQENALVQAGTGTGKSFATLIPAVLSGKRVAYSTATKQLSEQLIKQDIPALRKEMIRQGKKGFNASLLKGRDNYLCLKKASELGAGTSKDSSTKEGQDALFDDAEIVDTAHGEQIVESNTTSRKSSGGKQSVEEIRKEYEDMYAWIENTETGDRSDAPAVSDETWKGFSVTANECVGAGACPFAEQCFSERARNRAVASQIVVTNHAVTALSLSADEQGKLLGERDVYIFDEVHELDNFLSSAWGTTVSAKMVDDVLKFMKNNFKPAPLIQERWEKDVEKAGKLITDMGVLLDELEDGLIWPNPVPSRVKKVLTEISAAIWRLFATIKENEIDKGKIAQSEKMANSVMLAMDVFLENNPENVRWTVNERTKKEDNFRKNKGKKTAPKPATLHCAPIRIGPKLMKNLAKDKSTMIGTSATITVAGRFDAPIRDFGLALEDNSEGIPGTPFVTRDAGTPFNYSQQAMLYIPSDSDFPSADWKSRDEHSAAVEDVALKMVKALGGRTLILTTTTRRISEIGERLISELGKKSGIKVLMQGDMPPTQLTEAFVKNETSVLVATMGMWHGLNAEGATCMAVIMDKIPFPTMDDPLASARQKYANDNGGNGFMDVYVATANIKLAQGFGRLIRTLTDRGVVAILDTRMRTKPYGGAMLKSFPQGIRKFDDLDVVLGSLERLREAREKEIASK